MPCLKRLMAAVVACLSLASCGNLATPNSAPLTLQPVYPAALVQLCAPPAEIPGASADDVARALYAMYVLYGVCAGMHAQLVHWLESEQERGP